jgi:hypothetical protein
MVNFDSEAVRAAWDRLDLEPELFSFFTFQLLSLAGSVYAIGYLEQYVGRGAAYGFAGTWCRSRC